MSCGACGAEPRAGWLTCSLLFGFLWACFFTCLQCGLCADRSHCPRVRSGSPSCSRRPVHLRPLRHHLPRRAAGAGLTGSSARILAATKRTGQARRMLDKSCSGAQPAAYSRPTWRCASGRSARLDLRASVFSHTCPCRRPQGKARVSGAVTAAGAGGQQPAGSADSGRGDVTAWRLGGGGWRPADGATPSSRILQ